MKAKLWTIIIVITLIIELTLLSTNLAQVSTEEIKNKDNYVSDQQFETNIQNYKSFKQFGFTKNCGQIQNQDIKFYTQNSDLWFTNDGIWFEIREKVQASNDQLDNPTDYENEIEDFEPIPYKRIILKKSFIGANKVMPEGKQRLDYSSNFFYGNDSSKWKTDVLTYNEIYYSQLYDDIDLRYYITPSGLKYDFIVHPGADISQIRIRYDGATALDTEGTENLVIRTEIGNIVDADLFIYQDYNGQRENVEGKFIKLDELEYGFELINNYDRKEVLVIDPIVKFKYSTFLGGSSSETGYDIVADSSGNTYVAGSTSSSNFPTTPGANDTTHNGGSGEIFISKLNPSGSKLIYSTFIGGSGSDYPYGIKVDNLGNAYVTGKTDSTNFPTTSGTIQTTKSGSGDAFAIKLNPSGATLIYCTYLGGTALDEVGDIAIDSSGNAYITGNTYSSNYPTTPGAYSTTKNTSGEGFITKINSNGNAMVYSTFLGGDGSDFGRSISVDSNGFAYITGYTSSTNFPTTSGVINTTKNPDTDGFITKLNQAGNGLVYSTYLGGDAKEFPQGITLDSNNNVFITGRTHSTNYPTTPNAFDTTHDINNYDAFVTKINSFATSIIFSTYLGGNDWDESKDLAVDSAGNVYVTVETSSTDYPITPGAFDKVKDNVEVTITKLSANGSKVLFSSYLGSDGNDRARAIAIDSSGYIYLTGRVEGSGFPTTQGAFDTILSGFTDAYVVKIDFKPIINITSLSFLENDIPCSQVYARLCPHTFRVNITDTEELTDLGIVRLDLDPLGSNVQLQWDRSTRQFSEINDPNDYVTIESSSSSYNNSWDKWVVKFNITFNWNYPDENLHDVRVYATSAKLSPAWFNATSLYCVENDLVFNGSLVVKDEDEQILSENDIVRGGESISWAGLTVLYEGTEDLYPSENEFNISIIDEFGTHWNTSPASGEPFDMEIFTPNSTDMDGHEFKITISEIPIECDKTQVTFNLSIDGDNVTYSNATPNNETWQTNTKLFAGVTITDIGGGVVDGDSVRISISTNNGSSWSNWKSISYLESEKNITVQDMVTFVEGTDNLFKWMAQDSLANGPTESEPFRVLVDKTDIKYSDPWPPATEVFTSEDVNVKILISDEISGVDASTIEYAISNDKGKSWNDWVAVSGLNNSNEVNIKINITFQNGTDNMLKWRAKDIAGNGPTESQQFLIIVDTWMPIIKPKVTLISPLNGMKINDNKIQLEWVLEDKSMEGVMYLVYFDDVNPPVNIKSEVDTTSIIIDSFAHGEIFFWKVIPVLEGVNGTCSNGVWWFEVDLISSDIIFKLKLAGQPTISLYPGETKSITLSVTNLGSEKDKIRIELQSGILSNYISLEDDSNLELESQSYGIRKLIVSLPDEIDSGTHEIIVTAVSVNSGETVKENHMITIEIKDRGISQPNGTEPNGTEINGSKTNDTQGSPKKDLGDYLNIIMVLIIIIVMLIAVGAFVMKRRKKGSEELPKTDALTIKLGTQPAPTIIQGQVPPAVTIDSLASAGSLIADASQLPAATVTQQPTSAQSLETQKTIVSSQIPQVAQLPQLPPAQIQESTSEEDKNEDNDQNLSEGHIIETSSQPEAFIPSPKTLTIQEVQMPEVSTPSSEISPSESIESGQSNVQANMSPQISQTPTPMITPAVQLPESTAKPIIDPNIQSKPTLANIPDPQETNKIQPTPQVSQQSPRLNETSTMQTKTDTQPEQASNFPGTVPEQNKLQKNPNSNNQN
jgi:hypothetical protein